jgi:hypothetical protein
MPDNLIIFVEADVPEVPQVEHIERYTHGVDRILRIKASAQGPSSWLHILIFRMPHLVLPGRETPGRETSGIFAKQVVL